jgi:predicted ABC-type ATPase
LTETAKEVFVIGGPNGAGKTTTAHRFLPQVMLARNFLNVDEIAREISPLRPESAGFAAGRRLLERLREHIREQRSFALETTCSGKSYVPLLRQCVRDGWRFTFYYLWLPSPEDSVARVAKRVRQGGHFVPRSDIERRFITGLRNMRHLYLPLAHTAAIYDNSGSTQILIAEKESGSPLQIIDVDRWQRIEELSP